MPSGSPADQPERSPVQVRATKPHAVALLRNAREVRTSPFPRRTCPAGSTIGMRSAVQPSSTAARARGSATWRSKSRATRLRPGSFAQCLVVTARLRRWYPRHFRQIARPGSFDARRAAFRAMAPAVDGFHVLAFLCGGSEGMNATGPRECPNAWAPRCATASWHWRVSQAPSAVTVPISTSAGIWLSRSGSMDASPTLLPSTGSFGPSTYTSINRQ